MADNRTELEQAILKEIEVLSPLLIESQSLKAKAEKMVITDKDSAKRAKLAKRELIAHRTRVIDLRKSFTRNLDNVKSQLVAKQDEILKPSIEGEAILVARITEWDDEQDRIKAEEEERIEKILRKLDAPKLDRKTVSEEEVIRAIAALKMEQGLISQKDRNKKAIKTHFNEQNDSLKETLEFVHERDRQAAEAKKLADERAELEAKQKALDEKETINAKANLEADAARINHTLPTVDGSQNGADTPHYAPPPVAAIDPAFNAMQTPTTEESIYTMVNDLGQEAMDEAVKMLTQRLSGIEGAALGEEAQTLWKIETIEELYQIIANYQ